MMKKIAICMMMVWSIGMATNKLPSDVKINADKQIEIVPEGELIDFTTNGELNEEMLVGRMITGDDITIQISKNKKGKYDVVYNIENESGIIKRKSKNLNVYKNICIKDKKGCLGYDTNLKAPVYINIEDMKIVTIYFYDESDYR